MNIFEPHADYARHDTFLFALLGVAHANETLASLLASTQADVVENALADGDLHNVEHQQFVSALLGLISLAEQSQQIIDGWTKTGVEAPTLADSDGLGFDMIDDLMR